MAELNPLLEQTLRKDPARAAAAEKARRSAEVEQFLKSRAAQAAAGGGGFTQGVGDLLTFMPGAQAAKALKTGNLGPAAVNALAFTSQFDDSKLGENVGDALAFMPVFGFGSTRGIARGQDRLRKLAGKGVAAELPTFDLSSGKMAPRRLQLFEKGMRRYIEQSGAKDPGKQLKTLDDWLGSLDRSKPVSKKILGDRMPAELRPALYNTAVEQGYGKLKLPDRSKAPMDKFGNRVTKGENITALEAEGKFSSGGRMNPTQDASTAGVRRFEEVMPFGQKGGMPSKWEEMFRENQKRELGDRARRYLESASLGMAGGTALGLANGQKSGQNSKDSLAAVNPLSKLRRKVTVENNLQRNGSVSSPF